MAIFPFNDQEQNRGKSTRPMPVEKIERQINALGKRIDLITSRGSSPVGAAAVTENVEEIRASLEQNYPAPELSIIQDQIESLSNKFDEAINQTAARDQMRDLSSQIQAVQKSIAQRLDHPSSEASQSSLKLERLLLEIRDRLELSSRAAQSAAPALTDDIEKHIHALSEKIDAVASPIGIHHIAALEDNIQALARKIDNVATGSSGSSETSAFALQHIAALEDNIRSLTDKLDTVADGAGNTSLGALEAQVREIAERIENPNVSLQTLSSIEKTMSGMVEQFEEARLSTADAAENAAHNAAREAMDELLTRGALATTRVDETRDQITKEISGLRSSQENKDIRTQATLSAVHETLEKVVDRLAMLEDNVDTRQAVLESAGGGRTPVLGGTASTTSKPATGFAGNGRADTAPAAMEDAIHASEPDALLASGAAPRFARNGDIDSSQSDDRADAFTDTMLEDLEQLQKTTAPPIPTPARTSDGQPKESGTDKKAPSLNTAKALNLSADEAALWGDDDDEQLLEPGSGSPKKGRTGNATQEANATAPAATAKQQIRDTAPKLPPADFDIDDDDDDQELERLHPSQSSDNALGARPSSSFIAAARRASIAAQAEAEAAAGQVERKKSRGNKQSALSDARARATAAAASLSSKLERSALRNRKVLLSLGLAAAVLVLGTLQFLRSHQGTPAKSSALTSPRETATKFTGKPAPLTTASIAANKARQLQSRNNQSARAAAQNPHAARAIDSSTTNPAPIPSMLSGSFNKAQPMTTMANGFIKPPQAKSVDRMSVASIGPQRAAPSHDKGKDLQAEAILGNPAAQYELALRYIGGRTIPRDYGKAIGLLEKAAAKGLAPAQYRLGSMYEKGIGTKRDPAKALLWYERAGKAGNIRAMHNYAVMLAEGGVKKPNYPLAAQWFRKAADYGIRDSQFNLAILYARGLGIARSMSQSYKWFDVAARQGDKDAAGKRDQVARRLSKSELAIAKKAAQDFKPRIKMAISNTVPPPDGGWTLNTAGTAKTPAGAKAIKSKKRDGKVSSL